MHKDEIYFPNGNRALFVTLPLKTNVHDILEALNIEYPTPLMIIVGGAGNLVEPLKSHLASLFHHSIASVAASTGATIIDGGTHTGVMALIGQGVAAQGNVSTLLGISPAGLVTYPGEPITERSNNAAELDPNHSHFVLVEGDAWGSETATMFALAQALSTDRPVVTILINGGSIAIQEALQTVRYGWPLLVIEGSGRTADTIAHLWRERPAIIEDEALREIITKGRISLLPLTSSEDEVKRRITQILQTVP